MLYQTSGLADLPADAAEDADLDDSSSTAGGCRAHACAYQSHWDCPP